MTQTRLTIAQETTFEIDKIKGSRFIAYAYPLSHVSFMEEKVEQLWLKYPDARHICWAYRGAHPDHFRIVDDGEPSGTAGKPILTVLEGRGLESIGVAVIRYFGGTKLGTGGLARAYSSATQAVIKNCQEKHLRLRTTLTFHIHYSFEASLLYLLEQHEAVIKDRQYTDQVKVTAVILNEYTDTIKGIVVEKTSGQATIHQSVSDWS